MGKECNVNTTKFCMSSLKVQTEWNWRVVCLSVYSDGEVEYAQCDPCPAGEFRSWGPGGTCEGQSVLFSPRAPCGVDVAQSWSVPSSIPELCVRAKRGWCRGEVQALACVLVWLVEVFVGLYVELALVVKQRVLQSSVFAGIHSDEKTSGAMNH